MTGSFTSKIIEVQFTLSRGLFAGTDSNSVVLRGLRTHVEVEKGGVPMKCSAKVKIYGMSKSLISQLTMLTFNALSARRNLIEVRAGDSDGLSTVFIGEITGAWANYATPPDLYFEVQALTGFYASIAPSDPTSISGGVPVVDMMRSLANRMGYTFEDNGVTAVVANPYLSGSLFNQAETLARMANIDFAVTDNVMFITPANQPRKGGVTPVLTPQTGLREYPISDNRLMTFKSIFNPVFDIWRVVEVRNSEIDQANGVWRVLGLKHKLSSRSHQQNAWFSELIAAKVGG